MFTLTKEYIQECSLPVWIKKLKPYTVTTRVIGPLPLEFVQFLHQDGIQLVSNDQSNFSDEDDDDTDVAPPSFPDVEKQLRDAIQELGGKVFPKLNWSSPRDAAWIAMNASLECKTPEDVLMLLKASDFVAHDLSHPFEAIELDQELQNVYIVLRKWTDLDPSMEFRVVVKNDKIVIIVPRDDNYYPFLIGMRQDIEKAILDFFPKISFPYPNYIFDVYIDGKKRVTLIDINPYSPQTDLLLVDWADVEKMDEPSTPLLKLIESTAQANSQMGPRFSTNRVPLDAIALSQGRSVQEFNQVWQQELEKLSREG